MHSTPNCQNHFPGQRICKKHFFFDRHFRRILTLLWKLTKFNVSLYFLFVLGDAEADDNKLVADVADLDPDPVWPGPEVAVSLRICNLLMLFDAISRFFFLSKNNSQDFCMKSEFQTFQTVSGIKY